MYYMKSLFFLFFLLIFPITVHSQTQICYDAGKQHVALWEDYWKAGMYPGTGYWKDSLCPSWAGRLPGSATSNGKPACYVNAPISAINQMYAGYGHCRQQENVLTQECLNAEACLVAMEYSAGGLISVCTPLINTAIFTWDNGALDCNNMNRTWKSNFGDTWYVTQNNRDTKITGWVNTDTAYLTRGRCGWWQITGTLSKTGYLYVDTKRTGTKPRSSCLDAMAFSGTTTPDKATGSFRNGVGQVGFFEIYSQTPPPGFNWTNWTPVQPASVAGPYNPYEQ